MRPWQCTTFDDTEVLARWMTEWDFIKVSYIVSAGDGQFHAFYRYDRRIESFESPTNEAKERALYT